MAKSMGAGRGRSNVEEGLTRRGVEEVDMGCQRIEYACIKSPQSFKFHKVSITPLAMSLMPPPLQ